MERVKTQGKLSEAECLKYIRQIGSALEAVHQAGMVHRDAHPGNIMIQPNGNAILIDFGIAKEIIPAGSSSTNSGANLSFAPYEQIVEHFQSQDRALENITSNRKPSVDVYTLAATFYYAVTGQKPTPSMERRLDNRPLTSPKEINPNLSDHLNKAITLGMALKKENRPQSMSDWLQQLELPPPPVPEQYRQEIVNPPQPRNEPKGKDFPWGLLIGVFPVFGMFLVYGVIGYTLAANSARWQVWAGAWAAAVAVTWVATGAGVAAISVAWVAAVAVAGVAAVAVAGAGAGVWAVPWAGAVVVAWAVAGAVAGAWVAAVVGLWFYHRENTNQFAPFLLFVFPGLIGGITFSLMSGNVLGGIVTGIGSIVIVFTQGCTALELDRKNFSPFNIFLILAVTNLSSLASGWLLAFLLHSKG
jgi:serine/threonine-protein kinase